MYKIYVQLLTYVVLQNLINRQVAGSLTSGQHTEIRQSILHTVTHKHAAMQNFVRNKLVKVVVDVARIQWPHDYPHFIDDIMMVSGGERRVFLA